MAITIDKININRRNVIALHLTNNGVDIDLTGYIAHFSVMSADEEKIHVYQASHTAAATGNTTLYISEDEAGELVPGAWYTWEISVVDPDGYAVSIDNGMLQAISFQGSVSTSASSGG